MPKKSKKQLSLNNSNFSHKDFRVAMLLRGFDFVNEFAETYESIKHEPEKVELKLKMLEYFGNKTITPPTQETRKEVVFSVDPSLLPPSQIKKSEIIDVSDTDSS